MSSEDVYDAATEWQFRTDDRQFGIFTRRNGRERVDIEWILFDRAGDLRNARIAGNRNDVVVLRQFPGERVLTSAGANDKDPHNGQISYLV